MMRSAEETEKEIVSQAKDDLSGFCKWYDEFKARSI